MTAPRPGVIGDWRATARRQRDTRQSTGRADGDEPGRAVDRVEPRRPVGDAATATAAVRPWLVAVSPVYETPPWGPVPQDDYLNAVLLVDDASADGRGLARARARGRAARPAAPVTCGGGRARSTSTSWPSTGWSATIPS